MQQRCQLYNGNEYPVQERTRLVCLVDGGVIFHLARRAVSRKRKTTTAPFFVSYQQSDTVLTYATARGIGMMDVFSPEITSLLTDMVLKVCWPRAICTITASVRSSADGHAD